jgi:mRNA-degrading endonuclease toxin of MazEF toxin-antitoxin module
VSFTPVRGHIYRMDGEYGRLHCMALATHPVYEGDKSFIALRVAVTSKHHSFPGWVRMNSGDPVNGYIVVQDLDRVDREELADDLGKLSIATMFEVEKALRAHLGL